MCGISVIIDANRSVELKTTLLRMHAPIRHRGPDDERFLIVGDDWKPTVAATAAVLPEGRAVVGAAFRRLRIIDLSDAAAQPMPNKDRTIWICFNGEIYNFRSLRSRLESLGQQFRTDSDTEVALGAYTMWRADCFAQLDGMWAIVVIDLERRKVVVSRDRLGIKPLFWAKEG